MNINYVGSLAERFIQFRSGVEAASESGDGLFESVAIYVPSTLVTGNLVGVAAPTGPTEFTIKKVTYDDYDTVLAGELLRQWGPLFRGGANVEVSLLVVVFYVPSGSESDTFADYFTVDHLSISFAPLTAAFNETYVAAYWKVLFSPVSNGVTPGTGYDDTYYFDLSLSLAQLCLAKSELSYFLSFVNTTYPIGSPDTNRCLIASKDRAAVLAAATSLNQAPDATYTSPRANLYIGMLNLIQASNTWVLDHSENFNMFSEVLGLAYSSRNESGTFIGNKLSKIRLTGDNVKATGVPSVLDSEINANLPRTIAERLDSLYVSYLMSIAGDDGNNAQVSDARGVLGIPVIATAIARWVDYNTSKQLAKMIAAQSTLRNPVLKNENTYVMIQNTLLANLQRFARNGRIANIALSFPNYSALPESETDIVVSAAWTADYVMDIGRITISGTIVV